jgi:hypothetical protein
LRVRIRENPNLVRGASRAPHQELRRESPLPGR